MHTYQDKSLAATHTKYIAFHRTGGHPWTKLTSSRHICNSCSAYPTQCTPAGACAKASNCLMVRRVLSSNPPQNLGTTVKCALSASHAKLLLLSLALLSLGIECRLLSHEPVSV